MPRVWVRCPVITRPAEEGGERYAQVMDVPDHGKEGKTLDYDRVSPDEEAGFVRCLARGDDLSGLDEYPDITRLSEETDAPPTKERK